MIKLLKYPLLILWYFIFGISVLVWITLIFPLAFLVDYTVKNNTPNTFWITPIGIWHSTSDRATLPLYRSSFPQFILSKCDTFRVEPGETFQFTFDMDDVNISEIVIEDNAQVMRQIPVNHQSTTFNFEVSDLSILQPASASAQQAVHQAKAGNLGWLLYPVTGLVIIICVVHFTLSVRPNRKKESVAKFEK